MSGLPSPSRSVSTTRNGDSPNGNDTGDPNDPRSRAVPVLTVLWSSVNRFADCWAAMMSGLPSKFTSASATPIVAPRSR
jgi:hypothetical protein